MKKRNEERGPDDAAPDRGADEPMAASPGAPAPPRRPATKRRPAQSRTDERATVAPAAAEADPAPTPSIPESATAVAAPDDVQETLRHFSQDELLGELRAREASGGTAPARRGTTERAPSTVVTERSSALAGFDSAAIAATLVGMQKVIYGTDNRVDLFQVTDQAVLNDADSVVALFWSADVVDNGNGTSTLTTRNFGTEYNLCTGEPFRNQPIGAFCSGFLVGPDLIATAGHCVNANNVTTVRFVFGFRMQNATTARTVVNNADIYSGASIVGRQLVTNGTDWALVRLDRRVTNHRVVRIRRVGQIAAGQAVHVIGHPSGLPTKFAPGANVRDNSNGAFFVANLDTYGGNSGSPVFNAADHRVEGILVRGDTDFVSSGTCMVSLRCPDTGCRGEDCTRTTEFANLVPGVGFGNLADGRPFWVGNFSQQAGRAQLLFYYPGDRNWWLGIHDGAQFNWSLAGNTTGFGQVWDGRPIWAGDFSGDGRSDLLFYFPGDRNWWLGSHAGNAIDWKLVGNTAGFGQIWDGRPFWMGRFSQSIRDEILFYYPGDRNWWLGVNNGQQINWTLAGNTAGFGNVADGRPFWVANFTRPDRSDVLFYYPGDDNWWIGSHQGPGQQLKWSLAGNTAGFGRRINDGRPFWTGDFDGDGKTEILFYYPGDRNWWLGTFVGTTIQWKLVGNTAGFGQVWDGRPFWVGNFSPQSNRAQMLFYFPGDRNWWLGVYDGTRFNWTLAGNTAGFGNVADGRPFWVGGFSPRANRAQILFYFPGDGNWWLGTHDGRRLNWNFAGNTGSV